MQRLWQLCLVIGLLMMLGRLVTALLLRSGIQTTSLFFDLQLPSILILLVGLIGVEVTKHRKKG